MKKFYLLFLGLIFCFNSQSQVSQFNDSLMYGGSIQAYAKNSSCVLVATNGGIFKTTDDGQSWTNATQTFDPSSVSCRAIASIGNDFYAMSDNSNGSGIYKSNDNGTNWSALSFSSWWPQTLGKLSDTLYVVGNNYTTGLRLYSSTDGSSWIPKAIICDSTWQGGNCELLSFNQNKLYLVFNDTLYYTSDGSTIDTVSFNGLSSSSFSDRSDRIDGDSLGNLYCLQDDALYKYDFISKIWSDISTGQISTGYQIMDFSVTDNAMFLVAMHPLDIKFYKSTNQGSTFTEITSTGLAIPMIGNIIEVSTNGFIGNGLYDQILLSSDGGNTWSSNTNQYIATYAGNLTRSGNSLLYSKEPRGMIRSNNQGLNWSTANNGIPGFSGIAYFVDGITQVKDTLFSFCRPDPYTEQVALYKSSDNGTSWTLASNFAPYNTGDEYSFSGKCDSALFVSYLDTSSSDYALIVSFDNGSSWAKPNSQNSSGRIFLKGSDNCLFAFYANNDDWGDFDNVSKANNFGASFTDLNTGNLFNSSRLIKRVHGDRWRKSGAMMDFDETNNKAIFVVRDWSFGNGVDSLYLYDISSNIWSGITTTGLPSNYVANNIKYIGNNVWLLATNTGLYKSTNDGVAWMITHNTNNWQNGIHVNSIQMISNKAFLGTLANGVWMVDLAVGILEKVKDNDLQIFPNPTIDLINVVIPNFNGKTATVFLYGFDGRKIVNKVVNNSQFQLDLHNLPPGSYFIVINSDNDIYRKIVIRK